MLLLLSFFYSCTFFTETTTSCSTGTIFHFSVPPCAEFICCLLYIYGSKQLTSWVFLLVTNTQFYKALTYQTFKSFNYCSFCFYFLSWMLTYHLHSFFIHFKQKFSNFLHWFLLLLCVMFIIKSVVTKMSDFTAWFSFWTLNLVCFLTPHRTCSFFDVISSYPLISISKWVQA